MFKEIGNIASLMKTAQQMGGKMQQANDQLKAARVIGSEGGGMVEIEANGLGEVLRAKIDPTVLASGNAEMLEDLLPAAINQAQAKAKQMHREAMQSMTEGLNLPGLNIVGADEVAGLPDVVEDRESFEGNAVKKATELAAASGMLTLADDSGLEVDVLELLAPHPTCGRGPDLGAHVLTGSDHRGRADVAGVARGRVVVGTANA